MQPSLVQFEKLVHGSGVLGSMGWGTGFSIWLIVWTAAGAAMCSVVVVYFDRRGRPGYPVLSLEAVDLPTLKPPEALTPRELVVLLHSLAALDLSPAGSTAAAEYMNVLRAQLHRWECQPARTEAHPR